MFINEALYYFRGDIADSKKKLTSLRTDLFSLEGLLYFRLRFVKNNKNEVVVVEGPYDDGKKELSNKLK